MIENPLDQAGNPEMFPGAPAPDLAAHREATLRHLLRMAELDATYARWRAGTLSKENPDWHRDLLQRFDADLAARGIPRPKPFVDIPSRLPVLVKGRRFFRPKRFFHDTL